MAIYDYYDPKTTTNTSSTIGAEFDNYVSSTAPNTDENKVEMNGSDNSEAKHWNQERKADAGKLRMGLIPTTAYKAMAAVLTKGAVQYGDNTWQEVEPDRYEDALLRHLVKYMDEPDGLDDKSGLPHISHVLINAMFLNDFVVKELQKEGQFLQWNLGEVE